MNKFTDLSQINTENILEISSEHEYKVCTEFSEDDRELLLDDESLSSLLKDYGVEFISSDDTHYTYKLNDETFKVSYENISWEDDEEDCDQYLDFDNLIVN